MTNEEWERQVEFIVSQQAQFSADIQRLNELHEQADVRLTRLEKIIVGLHQDTENKLNALAEDTNAKFNALIDSQMRLVESQAKADERFDAFVNVVERYISEGRNGASKHQDKN